MLLVFSGACICYALVAPSAAGESIRGSLRLFGERVLPSLFLFSVSVKLIMGTEIYRSFEKTPLRHLFSLFGVSAGGFSALVMGLFAGFPVGAAALSDGVRDGALDKKEAKRLLPFVNQAGAGFVMGVGLSVFGSVKTGMMLYLAQTAAALLGVILTAKEPTKQRSAPSCKAMRTPASILTRAVSESALSMVAVCGYILFFGVISTMFLSVLTRFLPLGEAFFAFFSGLLELSGGLFRFKTVLLPDFLRLILCGGLLGFGGFSVFFQAADHAERAGIPTSFYFFGKGMTALFSAGFAPFFVFLSEKSHRGFYVFVVFALIFFIGVLKNKIFFKKTMEKRNGMLYNRNEIHCP